MAYVIEKDVPLPIGAGERGPRKYPWNEMEVGDSFVVAKRTASVSGICASASRRTGRKFVSRAIDANTCRVWRIA